MRIELVTCPQVVKNVDGYDLYTSPVVWLNSSSSPVNNLWVIKNRKRNSQGILLTSQQHCHCHSTPNARLDYTTLTVKEEIKTNKKKNNAKGRGLFRYDLRYLQSIPYLAALTDPDVGFGGGQHAAYVANRTAGFVREGVQAPRSISRFDRVSVKACSNVMTSAARTSAQNTEQQAPILVWCRPTGKPRVGSNLRQCPRAHPRSW